MHDALWRTRSTYIRTGDRIDAERFIECNLSKRKHGSIPFEQVIIEEPSSSIQRLVNNSKRSTRAVNVPMLHTLYVPRVYRRKLFH